MCQCCSILIQGSERKREKRGRGGGRSLVYVSKPGTKSNLPVSKIKIILKTENK